MFQLFYCSQMDSRIEELQMRKQNVVVLIATIRDSIVHWMKYGTEPFPRYQYPPQFQQSPIYNQYSQMMPQQDDFVFHSNIKFDQQNNSEPVSNYCTVNTFGFGNE